jgi:hypothetical protein
LPFYLLPAFPEKKYQEALTREQSLLSQNTNLSDEIVRLKGQVENLAKR